MNPNQTDTKRIKLIQYLTTGILVLILGTMVAGYIYYGMYKARNPEVVTPIEVPAETNTMDEAERQAIINALGQDASDLSAEKKEEIIDSLSEKSNQQLSPEDEAERQAIIEALKQN